MGEMADDDFDNMLAQGWDDWENEEEPVITRDSVWTTREGQHIRVRDMEDAHLFNAVAYFKDSTRPDMTLWRAAWLEELRHRLMPAVPPGMPEEELTCIIEQVLAETMTGGAP